MLVTFICITISTEVKCQTEDIVWPLHIQWGVWPYSKISYVMWKVHIIREIETPMNKCS